VAHLAASASQVDLGAASSGGLALTNTGNAVGRWSLSLRSGSVFSVSESSVTLGAGQSTTITIRIGASTVNGPYASQLTISGVGQQIRVQITAVPAPTIASPSTDPAMYYIPWKPACYLDLLVGNPDNPFPVSMGTITAYYNYVPTGSHITQYGTLTLSEGVAVLQPGELERWLYRFNNPYQWATYGRGTWKFQFHIPVSAGATSTTWITGWTNLNC